MGNTDIDRVRCLTFRYDVPAGGVQSASLVLAIDTLGSLQDTDATVIAVGRSFGDCGLAGDMPGCVVLHGGFTGEHRSLVLDLMDIACDPSVNGSPEKQAAVIEQLQTGVVHILLQDDTAVLNAELSINCGPPTEPCGSTSAELLPPPGEATASPADEPPPSPTDEAAGGGFGPPAIDRGPDDSTIVPPELIPNGCSVAAAPCMDPASEQCIEDWLRLVEQVWDRNEAERAPHRFTRWGQMEMENPSIRAFFEPDEFYTRYNGRRACFAWANYQDLHRWERSGGDVPSLAEFVAECRGQAADAGATGSGVCRRTIVAGRRVVFPDEAVSVPVSLLYPGGVANMNYSIAFDPAVVVAEGEMARGSVLGSELLFSSNLASDGLLRFGFAGSEGLFNDGPVANMRFRAVGQPGERTALRVEVQEVQDAEGSDLGIDRVDGEIVIVDPASVQPQPPPGSGQGEPPPGGGQPGGPGSEGPGALAGLCDGDPNLDVADAQCALDMSTGRRPMRLVVDMDGDGQVTSGDARQILQILQQLPTWRR